VPFRPATHALFSLDVSKNKTMKRSVVTHVGLFVAGAAIGLSWNYPRDVKSAQRLPPYSIQVHGVFVAGGLSDLQAENISAIVDYAKIVDKQYPLMGIEFLGPDKVEIQTGVIRGPLDGGGRYHTLEKRNGKWQVISDGPSKSWFS
jgi:hypothetical protein